MNVFPDVATQTFECVRTKITLVALKAVQRGLLARVHLAVVSLEAVLDGRRVVTEGTGQLESFVLQSDVISFILRGGERQSALVTRVLYSLILYLQ